MMGRMRISSMAGFSTRAVLGEFTCTFMEYFDADAIKHRARR
jgi:hypothetical protein